MLKRNLPGGRNRFHYLVTRAFKEAQEGDRESTLAYWDTAMGEGYNPHPRSKKQLMYLIRINEPKDLTKE